VVGDPQTAPLAIGQTGIQPTDSRWALVFAILIGVAVFAFLWRIRKTFGMKE